MQFSLAQEIQSWEDVLAQLRRLSVSWHGNSLSDRDRDTFTEAIVMNAICLTDISSQHGGIGSRRDIVGWAFNCASTDVAALGSFLSDVVTLLRSVSEPTTYNWFKRQLADPYPFVGKFLSPIKGILTSFLTSPNPGDFHVCYQFLSFMTHTTLCDLAIDLEEEYVELEHELTNQRYDESLLKEMNQVMREWLVGFSLGETTFHPKHGPGAIADASVDTNIQKYQYLGTDTLIHYVFQKFASVDVTSYMPCDNGVVRTSKFRQVPKSMKTKRGISMEPAALMYLQQGVASRIVDFIHQHSYLRGHIDFQDQTLNAFLAVRSSATQKYATIDLSSASDRVTTTLVKSVFYGTPLYPFLVSLRSRSVSLPSGKTMVIEKFAPMGSALCFPIQTLIFSCVIEVAARRARAATSFHNDVWRVFGDDIIVPDVLFRDVAEMLSELGFVLNRAKSFAFPARFRESCGGEGYDGINVSPLKIPRGFMSVGKLTSHHAAQYGCRVDFANACEQHNMGLLRLWLIKQLLNNTVAPPLFSKEGHGAVYSPQPDNYRARSVYNRGYRSQPDVSAVQNLEVLVAMPHSAFQKNLDDLEEARYFDTLRRMSYPPSQGGRACDDMFDPSHLLQVPSGPSRNRLRKRWMVIHPAWSTR